MANLESSFRNQILCGRYFNLPYTSLETIGLCVHYVYTHIQSHNLLLMISWCSVHTQWQERKNASTRPLSSCKIACIQEEAPFEQQRGKNKCGISPVWLWRDGKRMFLASPSGQAGSQLAEEPSQCPNEKGLSRWKTEKTQTRVKSGSVSVIWLK